MNTCIHVYNLTVQTTYGDLILLYRKKNHFAPILDQQVNQQI